MVTLALAPFVSAEGGFVRFEGELPANTWLAIRFNLTPDNDMTAIGMMKLYMLNETRFGAGALTLIDGDPLLVFMAPSGLAALHPNEIAHAATPTGRFGVDLRGGDSIGSMSFSIGHGGFWHPNESWAKVVVARAPASTYWLEASWSRGVTSWDVQTGPAVVEHRDEWGTGVHVGSHNIAAAASAGALLSRELHTERDTVGFFIGESTANYQESIWSCYEGSVACESYDPVWFGAQKVISKGPTDWRFAVDATVEVGAPSIALGVAELPGDDYLR